MSYWTMVLMEDRIFGLDFQLVVDTVISAIAVFFLFLMLSYLLFNPARELLKKRQEKIAGDLADAEKDKETAAQLKTQYDAKILSADKDAEAILSDSRRQALQQKDSIVAQAKEEATVIARRAQQDAELSKEKVRDEVKQEMITVAAAMAGKFVAGAMDTTKQEELLSETLREMGEDTWQS